MPSAELERVLAEVATTPCLVVDADVVARRFASLVAALPGVEIYYAVKANPAAELVQLLEAIGCGFDIASEGELELVTGLGARGRRVSFGNTIKRATAIEAAASVGVTDFAVDAPDELAKVAAAAPGSVAVIRLLCDPPGAAWPLSGKFGCRADAAVELGREAHRLGLGIGLSFHVGSQQRLPAAWASALADAGGVIDRLAQHGVGVELLNLGGGFPGSYGDGAPSIEDYGARILADLEAVLGARRPPRLAVEPGRYLVADAGVLRTEVLLVSPPKCEGGPRWVYVDVGVFSGLVETIGEAIRYPVRVVPAPWREGGGAVGPAILAGPTCDSLDVLAEERPYDLPVDLREGDRIDLMSAGAYTASCSSVGFNGFPPLRQIVLGAPPAPN